MSSDQILPVGSTSEAVLSIPDTRELLARTGNIAVQSLEGKTAECVEHICRIIRDLQVTVDGIDMDSKAFVNALPEGKVPSIAVSTLLDGIDVQVSDIYEANRNPDGVVYFDSFTEEDKARLDALSAVDDYVIAAYGSMVEDGLTQPKP